MKNVFESTYEELDRRGELYECDGGAPAGGISGGDMTTGTPAGPAGGITSDSVLGPSGEFEKGHGCLGKGDFHVAFPVCPMLFRYGKDCCNGGGSKKKRKGRNGKTVSVKNPYVKGMTTIVAEGENGVTTYSGQAKAEFDKVVSSAQQIYTGVLNYNDALKLAWMVREDGVLRMYKPMFTGKYWTVYATTLMEDGMISLDYKGGMYPDENSALTAVYREAEKHKKALEEHVAGLTRAVPALETIKNALNSASLHEVEIVRDYGSITPGGFEFAFTQEGGGTLVLEYRRNRYSSVRTLREYLDSIDVAVESINDVVYSNGQNYFDVNIKIKAGGKALVVTPEKRREILINKQHFDDQMVNETFDQWTSPDSQWNTDKRCFQNFPGLDAKTAKRLTGLDMVEFDGTLNGVRSCLAVGEGSDRVYCVVVRHGVNIPFYVSTGGGGKKRVPTGKWYPFFGKGPDGWLNKGGESDILIYYGSKLLRDIAHKLDSALDMTLSRGFPRITEKCKYSFANCRKSALRAIYNKDLNPVELGDPGWRQNIDGFLATIQSGETYYDKRTSLNERCRPEDMVFVRDIPVKRLRWLLNHSKHDVDNFCPDYIRKTLRSSPMAWGAFSRFDRKNALALATVIEDMGPGTYLHELAGFMKGGSGRALTLKIMDYYGRVWGQVAQVQENDGRCLGTNKNLLNDVYRKIPGLKFYSVSNSIWDGAEATFLYYGIPDVEFAEYCETNFGKNSIIAESDRKNAETSLADMAKNASPEVQKLAAELQKLAGGELDESLGKAALGIAGAIMLAVVLMKDCSNKIDSEIDRALKVIDGREQVQSLEQKKQIFDAALKQLGDATSGLVGKTINDWGEAGGKDAPQRVQDKTKDKLASLGRVKTQIKAERAKVIDSMFEKIMAED